MVADPTNASNKVARVVKSATAELSAGVTVSTGANNTVGTIPFTATSTRMTVRVYSPRAGIPVRLKVEDAADPTRSVETEALTTMVNTWETLTFDFANQVAGTAALNLAYTYNRLSIFFDYGKTGAAGGSGTFYFDDVLFDDRRRWQQLHANHLRLGDGHVHADWLRRGRRPRWWPIRIRPMPPTLWPGW